MSIRLKYFVNKKTGNRSFNRKTWFRMFKKGVKSAVSKVGVFVITILCYEWIFKILFYVWVPQSVDSILFLIGTFIDWIIDCRFLLFFTECVSLCHIFDTNSSFWACLFDRLVIYLPNNYLIIKIGETGRHGLKIWPQIQ